jgi:hypothetical protein
LGIFRSVYIFVCKKKSTMPAAYGICLIWNIKKKSNVLCHIECWIEATSTCTHESAGFD